MTWQQHGGFRGACRVLGAKISPLRESGQERWLPRMLGISVLQGSCGRSGAALVRRERLP